MGDAVVGDAGGINPTNGINSSCTIDASNITDILMDESVVCDAGGINPLDVSISQFLEDVFQDEDGASLLDPSYYADNSINQVEDDGSSLLDAGPPSLA
eukprot:2425011-Prorocentrum_lima.AAC.1